jgi:hypothetical protein
LLFFFCLAVVLPACGRKQQKNVSASAEARSAENIMTESLVQISGTVRLVGSEPFTELVITGSDWEWYVDRNEYHKLRELQHRVVTVGGTETIVMLTFANGSSAGERRTLKDITVINVE